MHIATHDGMFHADDVFALAVIRMFQSREGRSFTFERTRDPERLARADVRVDVGGAYDLDSGDYDHHQVGGAGVRENGVPYASFGLVWRTYGPLVCMHGGTCEESEALARSVDATLVQFIDAGDVGHQMFTTEVEGAVMNGVDRLISNLNPVWDDPRAGDPDSVREAFERAMELAHQVIRFEMTAAAAKQRARSRVVAAVAESRGRDARLVTLSENLPWRSTVMSQSDEALLVVFPTSDGSWGVQSVPVAHGSFVNRLDLPQAWAGLRDEELAQVTGVQDAVFSHAGRFFAVARTHEGAQRLAQLALAES